MSFLPKIRYFGKIPKKISLLNSRLNIKIYFENFARNIKFFIKKHIWQRTHKRFASFSAEKEANRKFKQSS
jgi:hypothetical protein